MQSISALVANVVFIIFLTTIMDLLMPHSRMKSYIKLVMGLFVILSIVQPILALFDDNSYLSSWIWTPDITQEQEIIMAQGKTFSEQLTTETLEQYKQKVAQQMNGLLALISDIDDSEVTINLDEMTGAVTSVDVYITTEQFEHQEITQQVKKLLTNYFGLSQEILITTHFILGGDADEQ